MSTENAAVKQGRLIRRIGTAAHCAFAIALAARAEPLPRPEIPYAPRQYVCQRTPTPLDVDGRLDEPAWEAAAWTEPFIDIEGDIRPRPRFRTRAKMLWDDGYFYVAAEMEEPHVWGTLTARDAVIYHDNDFEVFIDPDGDTHEYYELEINALGTVWDLLLLKPYRDGAPAVDAWDIAGLRTGVHIDGTLNDPADQDRGWSVEIALPWEVLAECAHRAAPPLAGDQWRVNFSRVQWRADIVAGAYRKSVDPATGETLPEDNWVWSPQGLIAMHYPEMWGWVQFSDREVGTTAESFQPDPHAEARRALWRIYYAQRDYRGRTGRWATSLEALELGELRLARHEGPHLDTTPHLFEARVRCPDQSWLRIRQDGKIW